MQNTSEKEKMAVHEWLMKKLDIVPFEKTHKVLELDSGKGPYTIPIAKRVEHLTACSTEKDIIRKVEALIRKENIENVTVYDQELSYEKLPFENDSFDAVSCRTCIHHTSFINFPKVLKEIHRVLKKDGFLSIMDGIVSAPFKEVWTLIARMREYDHHHYYTYHELLSLLAAEYFSIEEIIPYRIPRSLDEWTQQATTSKMAKKAYMAILNSDIICEELDLKNYETPEELKNLNAFGIHDPEPGRRYWYHAAEILAVKKGAEGRIVDRRNTLTTCIIPNINYYPGQAKRAEEAKRVVSRAFGLIEPYLNDNQTVLDMPCGQGEATALLAAKVKTVYALDPQQKIVEGLRSTIDTKRINNVEILGPISNKDSLPFEDKYFDAAVTLAGTVHFPSIEFLFSEVSRVLKKGSPYAVLTPIYSDSLKTKWYHLMRLAEGSKVYLDPEYCPMKGYPTYIDVVKAAQKAKLRIELICPSQAQRLFSEYLKDIENDEEKERILNMILKQKDMEDARKELNIEYSAIVNDWCMYYNGLEILMFKE